MYLLIKQNQFAFWKRKTRYLSSETHLLGADTPAQHAFLTRRNADRRGKKFSPGKDAIQAINHPLFVLIRFSKILAYLLLTRLGIFRVKVSPFALKSALFHSVAGCFVLAMLAIAVRADTGGNVGQIVHLYGEYNGKDQEPTTGKLMTNGMHTCNVAFHIALAGDAWIITATNLNEINVPQINWRLPKGTKVQVWCDGTNTYSLQSDSGDNALLSNTTNLVTVDGTRFYTASYGDDILGISLPWLTYCFSPRDCEPDGRGIVTLPVPWLQPRFDPTGYGFKWVINGAQGGRFLKDFKLVRDSALDLSDKDWLLRTTFVFPSSLPEYERMMRQIATTRAIPNGWVQAEFKCLEEYHTNGLFLPRLSVINEYTYNPTTVHPHPYYVGQLRLSNVAFETAAEDSILPKVVKPTRAFDFRYRQTNSDRIYRLAEYTLNAGDMWKSKDDKLLLAEANDYLKHGPGYDDFLYKQKHKLTLVWLVFGIVSVIPLLAILKNATKEKQTNK